MSYIEFQGSPLERSTSPIDMIGSPHSPAHPPVGSPHWNLELSSAQQQFQRFNMVRSSLTFGLICCYTFANFLFSLCFLFTVCLITFFAFQRTHFESPCIQVLGQCSQAIKFFTITSVINLKWFQCAKKDFFSCLALGLKLLAPLCYTNDERL